MNTAATPQNRARPYSDSMPRCLKDQKFLALIEKALDRPKGASDKILRTEIIPYMTAHHYSEDDLTLAFRAIHRFGRSA